MTREIRAQTELFAPAESQSTNPPPGFMYRPDVLTRDEETQLIREIAALPLAPFEFRGYHAKRRVASFGYRYDFMRHVLEPAPAMPEFLLQVRRRLAALTPHAAEEFCQAIALEYTPGAQIGWHRDRPQFGVVAGVSLGAPAFLRFRREDEQKWRRTNQPLAPRSAYVLTGEARSVWEHSIPPLIELRYAVTFRTLRSSSS